MSSPVFFIIRLRYQFFKGCTMVPGYALLAPHYDALWAKLVPSPEHLPELNKICDRLKSNQAVYEQVSTAVWGKPDYWWYVAITDQMEAGGGANTYLGNGQSLERVTTEVPAGKGPFYGPSKPGVTLEQAFIDGAVDALRGVPEPSSISQAAFNMEGFNGWGYLNKPIEDPYLASWSNQYTKGKYVADHQYDPNAVSGQPGALTILKVLMPAYSPHGPVAIPATPPAPAPAPDTSPVIADTGGHVMVDVTTIETDVNYALSIAEDIIPWASTLIPGFAPVGNLLLQVINGVRTIEGQLGIPTTAAVAAATSYATPGAPNAAPLNG